MRIISKFQDYYDGVQAYGHDETLTYVRKVTKIKSKKFKSKHKEAYDLIEKKLHRRYSLGLTPRHIRVWENGYKSLNLFPFLIGFCGKYYVVLQHTCPEDEKVYNFYSTKQIEAFLRSDEKYKLGLKRFIEGETAPKFRWSKVYKKEGKPWSEIIDRFFDLNEMGNKDCIKSLFATYKVPVFVLDDDLNFFTNKCLKDYSFYKCVDTFTAFQEIEMYLGGVLGADAPEMATIDDIYMRDKKGFNEMSFKKRPTKRGK